MRLDYDTYSGLADKPDEAEEPEAAKGIDLDALLKEDLLWSTRETLEM